MTLLPPEEKAPPIIAGLGEFLEWFPLLLLVLLIPLYSVFKYRFLFFTKVRLFLPKLLEYF